MLVSIDDKLIHSTGNVRIFAALPNSGYLEFNFTHEGVIKKVWNKAGIACGHESATFAEIVEEMQS